MAEIEDIALFDMDGTLCDYDKGLFDELEILRSSHEPIFEPPIRDDAPVYIRARADLIRSNEDWWANLPKFKLGFDVWKIAEELDFRRMILTQGPRRNPSAWSGKKKWIDRNLGEDVDITITRDKGLVYGKVLVDDFPGYIEGWLKYRPRGLVIMPASKTNSGYTHPQVIRYNGNNLEQVREAMKIAKLRK
jgi:FMN phosphatase YigB (HAD superfamily)